MKPAMPPIEEVGGVKPVSQAPSLNLSNNASSNVKTASSAKANSVVDLVRFKEFKITGTIFGKGESRISYTSLKHMVENAQKMHYSETMISAAIIKAISPNHKLQKSLHLCHWEEMWNQ